MLFIGILITLALAAAAIWFLLQVGIVWAVIFAVASIVVGAVTMAKRKKKQS